MTSFNQELEQRLKNLEVEQEEQDVALTTIGDLDREVRQLEAALAEVDNYQTKQPEDYEPVYDPVTWKLESELLDDDGHAPVNKNATTYVIRLMFNPKSPQEWSGTGWCEFGKGKRYSSLEQVNQIFKELKKRWPTYPLKRFKG